MIHIAIVEDDAKEHERLAALVSQIASAQWTETKLSSFYTSDSLLTTDVSRYDLILLDIQMPGTDGMTAARRIREMNESVMLVFVTSMAQYALQGYSVEALDFLVKPVERTILEACLCRAFRRLHKASPACLNIKSGTAHIRLAVSDIVYAEAQGRRVLLHTAQEAIPYSGTLGALENELMPHGFFRCHSAFLVALGRVERIEGNDVYAGGTQLPVSKHRRKAFLSALAEHWGDTL